MGSTDKSVNYQTREINGGIHKGQYEQRHGPMLNVGVGGMT